MADKPLVADRDYHVARPLAHYGYHLAVMLIACAVPVGCAWAGCPVVAGFALLLPLLRVLR